MTRDVSACGMFFETIQTFIPGQCLQLTLVLEHIDPGRQVRLQCRDRVVRIEPCDTEVGIAVDITAYRLDPGVYDGGGCYRERCDASARP